jgi:hypothetical protein
LNGSFPGKGLWFTQEAKGLAREIHSAVLISVPEADSEGVSHNKPVEYRAIWDTGATRTVITEKVAQDLRLMITGYSKIGTVGGIIDATEHRIDIWLPNRLRVEEVPVLKGCISDKFDVLIGMDIITMGDFAFTNFGGRSVFSFRIPSLQTIDFAERREPSRNAPCPCGSGKKYKHCHGKAKII